jgi:hypothetical protein
MVCSMTDQPLARRASSALLRSWGYVMVPKSMSKPYCFHVCVAS